MAGSVSFDPQTALVVVDVQNDFADPAGSLYVSGGESIVPVVDDLITAASDGGATIVYTQDWHPPSTPHFDTDGGRWPVHCVAGTWGAALYPELRVVGPVIQKGTGGEDGYSGFTARDPVTGEEKATGLDALLRERDATRVVVCGLALDVCVKETVLDARRLGYDVVVPLTATRPVNLDPDDGDRAAAAMAAAGAAIG